MSAAAPAPRPGWADSVRRIVPLAWPVVVGQIAVLAFSIIDTLLVGRAGTTDLAALAVGSAAFVTVFVGFMGVLMALAPVVGQLYGAGRRAEIGTEVHQALWLALGLSALGSTLLLFPAPFLALANATPEVAAKVTGYLQAQAFALPASLLFMVFRALNTAVSRPKAVMLLQMAALALKLPLSVALLFGVPALGIPAMGVVGCGIATAACMWAQTLAAWLIVRRDPFYAPFAIVGRPLARPDRAAILELLKLGLPMGGSILVEVSGFSFMAIFIARLGATPVAGHQLAVNLVSVLFMVPLGLANATSALVAQSIGAGRAADARRLGWHGLALGTGLAALVAGGVLLLREPLLGLYTRDPLVLAAALPLIAWLVPFHIADAAQTLAAYVLRAYKIATVPMVIYVGALWGVGLGGGWVLAFNLPGGVPPALQGASGFWVAATAGLVLAGVALSLFMAWVFRQQQQQAALAA